MLLRSYMMARAWLFSSSCRAAETGGTGAIGAGDGDGDGVPATCGVAAGAASFCACQSRFNCRLVSYWSRIGFSLLRARLSVRVTVENAV
ncbi:hypothetical protein DMB66_17375 [Actinoplanes sp. ATCC 53533]|nr:hypothetical protein DMB66_17375 [Actinoplanes sp. ATCC 53533]